MRYDINIIIIIARQNDKSQITNKHYLTNTYINRLMNKLTESLRRRWFHFLARFIVEHFLHRWVKRDSSARRLNETFEKPKPLTKSTVTMPAFVTQRPPSSQQHETQIANPSTAHRQHMSDSLTTPHINLAWE